MILEIFTIKQTLELFSYAIFSGLLIGFIYLSLIGRR